MRGNADDWTGHEQSAQERAMHLLEGRGIPYETIDGADPENRET